MLSLILNLIAMMIRFLLHLAFLFGQLLGQGLVGLYRRTWSRPIAPSGAPAQPMAQGASPPPDMAATFSKQAPPLDEGWRSRPAFRQRPQPMPGPARRF